MWLDNASDIDILFYDPYAQLISSIAEDKINSLLTIGVFGLWGAGKSTLLNLIEQQLNEDDANVTCVKVNAWMFEGWRCKNCINGNAFKRIMSGKEIWKNPK